MNFNDDELTLIHIAILAVQSFTTKGSNPLLDNELDQLETKINNHLEQQKDLPFG